MVIIKKKKKEITKLILEMVKIHIHPRWEKGMMEKNNKTKWKMPVELWGWGDTSISAVPRVLPTPSTLSLPWEVRSRELAGLSPQLQDWWERNTSKRFPLWTKRKSGSRLWWVQGWASEPSWTSYFVAQFSHLQNGEVVLGMLQGCREPERQHRWNPCTSLLPKQSWAMRGNVGFKTEVLTSLVGSTESVTHSPFWEKTK